jgi:hypothetical protein
MKKIFTLLIVFCGLFAVLNAQTALDPNKFVNEQITEAGVYTVEAGKSYAFDGRLDLTFEVTIEGPDNGWIGKDVAPPVLVNTPAADGSARQFFEVKENGSLTLKNVLITGLHSNDELTSQMIMNTAGESFIVDNCAFADWANFALRNRSIKGVMSVTNCVFINGVRPSFSQWGGMPIRLDVGPENFVYENNTIVNSGRLFANMGPYLNTKMTELHNTFVNTIVMNHEQVGYQMLQANNLFYNYHWIGMNTENHSVPDLYINQYMTTFNYFAWGKERLDSTSLYLGQNLFYRPQEISDWFVEFGGDSIAESLLWEIPDVDSFIVADDNYTIGTNYAEMEPNFTTPVGNLDKIVENLHAHRLTPTADWVDWRSPSPVTFTEEGLPALSWPPAFDLSYSHKGLQVAGTDGLPLGDLNWFPEKKAEYLANRDAFIEMLIDSMANATAVYDPLTMDDTPMITEISDPTSAKQVLRESANIHVYPNPARDMISVYGIDQAGSTITFYDLLGKEIELVQLEGLNTQLDISHLDRGVYLYRINTADNVNVKAGKLMIMK